MTELRNLTLEELHQLRSQLGEAGQERIAKELKRREEERRAAAAKAPKRETKSDRIEKEEQAEAYRRLVAIGCKVYWLSQPRETMQTAGLPDLLVFGPASDQFAMIEMKRAKGGKISLAQSELKARCRAAGIDHVLGGLAEVADHYGFEVG